MTFGRDEMAGKKLKLRTEVGKMRRGGWKNVGVGKSKRRGRRER